MSAILMLAGPAWGVASEDKCPTVCTEHKLQWREFDTNAWVDVSTQPVAAITYKSNPLIGVNWDGIPGGLSGVGYFRAKAMRNGEESPYSTILFVGEAPTAPMLLSGILMIGYLKRRRNAAHGSA